MSPRRQKMYRKMYVALRLLITLVPVTHFLKKGPSGRFSQSRSHMIHNKTAQAQYYAQA